MALVFLLNVLGDLRTRNYRPDAWWIPFVILPSFGEELASLAVCGLLAAYALVPPRDWGRRRATRIAIELLSVLIAFDVLNFYGLLIHGKLHSGFPVPFSLLLGIGLWVVWWGVGIARPLRSAMDWPIILVMVLLGFLLTPPLQMLCNGLAEYQDKSDVAIIFSTPLLPDGQPSPAMRARVSRGVQLFKDGKVTKLYLSGSAGQPHMMRKLAVAAGVPVEEILLQVDTDRPDDIVRDVRSNSFFADRPKMIAVSDFEQLPRIRMLLSQEEGWQAVVQTAPAGPAPQGTLKAMCAEILPFWQAGVRAITH